MTIIGKTAGGILYHKGDFMWPWFKWTFILSFVGVLAFCIYSFFFVAPNISGTPHLIYAPHLWVASKLSVSIFNWFWIPFVSALGLALTVSIIAIRIAFWIVKDLLGDITP